MKRHITSIVSAALVALTLIGCKPTEKNYKAAYDAANAKREQAAAEQMRPATGLLSDDGPQMKVVEGDTIYVDRQRLRDLDGKTMTGKWAVAVGVFKMDTNAKASVEAMKQKGFSDAAVAKVGGQRFYVMLRQCRDPRFRHHLLEGVPSGLSRLSLRRPPRRSRPDCPLIRNPDPTT